MIFLDKLQQAGRLAGLAIVIFAIVAVVLPGQVHAVAPMGARYIQMADSSYGATTTYKTGFTTVTTGTVGSVKIEFCSNSPIVGDSCTAPGGLNVNKTTVTIANQTGSIGTLAVDVTDSTTNVLILSTTPASAAAGAQAFEMVGITNPTTTNTTFYAKISTHAAADASDASIDAGGLALSTANQLTVTAKVQETLTFCVYTSISCGAGGTGVILGDSNGVLASPTTQYTDTASYDLASNAISGVVVKLKGGLLTSGSNTISSSGPTCTTDSTSSSIEQFGFRMSALGSGQTAQAPYNCASGSHAFDTANTTTTYGQNIATTSGANDLSSSVLEFTAKAASTTEAGIYTSTMTLIATATY